MWNGNKYENTSNDMQAAWAAPEVLKKLFYTEKADVYSYGICLWEFLSRFVVNGHNLFFQKIALRRNGNIPDYLCGSQ